MSTKNILFISGTRADFGKLKALINAVKNSPYFEYQIFVTGMHLMSKYGGTIKEFGRSGFDNVYSYMNQIEGESMETIMANTITGLSRYLHEYKTDLIVVHGDRVEALAGATVGALRNILVAHVEGGEISGTVDELMRHAISKMSHIHFVVSSVAEKRLWQMGERLDTIFKIGSPDVDVIFSKELPSLIQSKNRYQIEYKKYSIAMLHPVTTELNQQLEHAEIFVESLISSKDNYIVIYPNNDSGSEFIFKAYERLKNIKIIKLFPSLRFEYFLTLLKNCDYIIGNSSAGIHEAPVMGIPTINIGTRQNNRFKHVSIYDVQFNKKSILNTIDIVKQTGSFPHATYFGDGQSARKFMDALKNDVWNISNQKQFQDMVNLKDV